MLTVIKSETSFNEVVRDLRGCGSVVLPASVVPAFVDFCNVNTNVRPQGGALVQAEDGQILQYLYL